MTADMIIPQRFHSVAENIAAYCLNDVLYKLGMSVGSVFALACPLVGEDKNPNYFFRRRKMIYTKNKLAATAVSSPLTKFP